MKKYQMVYIEWHDAMAHLPTWASKEVAEEFAQSKEGLVRQVGWIVKETKHYVLLTSRIGKINLGEVEFGGLFKIPRGCIKTMREIVEP